MSKNGIALTWMGSLVALLTLKILKDIPLLVPQWGNSKDPSSKVDIAHKIHGKKKEKKETRPAVSKLSKNRQK